MGFRLKGVIPPMITPFTETGELDEKNLAKLVEYLSEKVDGLFICGSYGCGAIMSLEERKKVAEITKKHVKAGTTVIVHTGTPNLRDTLKLTRHAASIGCDAAAAVGPYYYKYHDTELIKYYSSIIKEMGDFPIYVYNNPGFQGYEMSIDMFKALKEEGLSGIKDATFNILNYATYQRVLADENFDIASGTEALWVASHALGCEAFIPGIGNVFPDLCEEMYQASMNGEDQKALDIQFKINAVRNVLYYARSTQIAVYAIADLLNLMKIYPRLPFVKATENEKKNLYNGLKEIGVI